MDALDRIKNLNQNYKIGLVLLTALLVGVVASSFQTTPFLGSSNSQADYRGEDLARHGKVADAGNTPSVREESSLSGSDSSDRKIVTTVRTTLKVNDVATAQEDVRQQVKQYNGFIERSSIDQRNEVSGSMTVAVPAENLSDFTSGLESNYKVDSQSSDRSDVTDRYNELEAELESKKQEMERLEELMNRSENVSDLVEIQERMSELRSRINYLQKRLDNLDERVNYSKVYITFEGPELLKASFDLRETLFDAYRAVFDSVRLMILGAAYLLPFAALIGLYKVVTRRARA
jgi:hypothetical protein